MKLIHKEKNGMMLQENSVKLNNNKSNNSKKSKPKHNKNFKKKNKLLSN